MFAVITATIATLLDPISITPPSQKHISWLGTCEARIEVFVPAHPDNRYIVIKVSDAVGEFQSSDVPITHNMPLTVHRIYSLLEEQSLTITAWLYGPEEERVRSSAVAKIDCV